MLLKGLNLNYSVKDGVKVSFGENNSDSSMYIQLAERLGAQVKNRDKQW